MNTTQPTVPRELAAELDRGDPITIGALTLQRAPDTDANTPLIRLSLKGRSQIYTLDELEKKLGSTEPSSTPQVWPACPTWCVEDVRFDEGTADEMLLHNGAVREAGGFRVQLQRTDGREGQGDTVEIFLDDTEMTPVGAAALAAQLSAAVADAGVGQMAGHHWTKLQGWETAAWAREVTSQDVTRANLRDELRPVLAAAEVDDGEDHGPVGGLLVQRIDGGKPHLIMLAGQTALEERITVDNAMWLLSCGAPARQSVDRVRVPGQGMFWVVPIHCRSVVDDRMQEGARALVAQLPEAGAR